MTTPPKGNEKLLKVRAEIEAILKANDVGAHVVLHMPGFLENFGHYEPSYSRLRPLLDEGGRIVGMRIRSKLDLDYNGDKEKQLADLSATSNFLSGVSAILAQDAISLGEVSEALDKLVGAEHTPLRPI
jgi:hypothetical protein